MLMHSNEEIIGNIVGFSQEVTCDGSRAWHLASMIYWEKFLILEATALNSRHTKSRPSQTLLHSRFCHGLIEFFRNAQEWQ